MSASALQMLLRLRWESAIAQNVSLFVLRRSIPATSCAVTLKTNTSKAASASDAFNSNVKPHSKGPVNSQLRRRLLHGCSADGWSQQDFRALDVLSSIYSNAPASVRVVRARRLLQILKTATDASTLAVSSNVSLRAKSSLITRSRDSFNGCSVVVVVSWE